MDRDGDMAERKPWKFTAFTINGAIGFLLPIAMFFFIAYGYAYPEPRCTDSFLYIGVRWGCLLYTSPSPRDS